jgi:hypothetical protein
MKYVRKDAIVEATQWWKNGDHPLDESTLVKVAGMTPFLSEGKIVRRFRHPDVPGSRRCSYCRGTYAIHGWIDNARVKQQESYPVCPGDYVLTLENGTYVPCKPDLFEATYIQMAEVPPT